MFDYKKFEDDIVIAMENTLKGWMEEYDDIYILSLDCSRSMDSIGIIANTKEYFDEQVSDEPEDYYYYKYCAAEWELYDDSESIKEISAYMRKYVEDNTEQFTDPETYVYLDAFDEHCDKIVEASKKALERFRQYINKYLPDLLLAFSIEEYLSNEECIEIFSSVNSKEASKEYAEHIDDFN